MSKFLLAFIVIASANYVYADDVRVEGKAITTIRDNWSQDITLRIEGASATVLYNSLPTSEKSGKYQNVSILSKNDKRQRIHCYRYIFRSNNDKNYDYCEMTFSGRIDYDE